MMPSAFAAMRAAEVQALVITSNTRRGAARQVCAGDGDANGLRVGRQRRDPAAC